MITAGDGEESSEEFHDLVKQLREEYEPIGVVEESLVQTIAACWWRKARVLRAENGEIRKRLDTLAIDREQQNSYKSNRDLVSSQIPILFSSAENQADRPVVTKGRKVRRARSTARFNQTSLRSVMPD